MRGLTIVNLIAEYFSQSNDKENRDYGFGKTLRKVVLV